MKISIVAGGTRGDVQPYVALGGGLQRAGYDVRVLTTDDFEGLTTGAGLQFCSTGKSIEGMLQSDEWRKTTERGNFFVIMRQMQKEVKKQAENLAQILPPLLKGTDLIVTGAGGMGGTFSIAEKLNIPVIQAYVFPFSPTSEFPSPLTPTLPLGQLLNRFSFHTTRQMIWQTTRMADVATRKILNMPKGSFFGHFRRMNREKVPALYGYSNHVLPRPTDWEAHIHVTGYWYLDTYADWTPPADLVTFLADGSAPVYIGFGSMGSKNPEEAGKIALKALELSGQRGVIASGWGGMKSSDLPPTVYMLSSVPHSWLFPQMTTVVHHGGAGTTAAGLRAGIPSIIIPFMGDQPYWGHRVHQLGVGTKPIPRKKLTAENLAQAITQAVSDTTMRQKAKELGDKICIEDGIGNAVTHIQQISAI